ncbi:MAG: hypothetical protein JWP85_2473 [Rhodoglobus sp.]|nr:hypothetical protein [Rhodoglobus sp.]
MVRSTWAELTAGLSPADLELYTAYRDRCRTLPGCEERVHRTEVQYALHRVFTSGHMKSHRLQLAVDLLREAEHPLLRQAFHTTKKVITHRIDVTSVDELETVMPLIREAHDDVGPGTA